MSRQTASYEFGAYRLDPLARVLRLRDRPIALAPKSFDLLRLLVEGHGRVLERDELFRELWPGTSVEEANLTFQVSTARKALGEDGSGWIETVPKHGTGSWLPFGRCGRRLPDAVARWQPGGVLVGRRQPGQSRHLLEAGGTGRASSADDRSGG